jgi:hypothetical protein
MNDGGPAFPLDCNVEALENGEGVPQGFVIQHLQAHQGMSLRDYFAAAALTGLCANHETLKKGTTWLSSHAYIAADEMLSQRAVDRLLAEHRQQESESSAKCAVHSEHSADTSTHD